MSQHDSNTNLRKIGLIGPTGTLSRIQIVPADTDLEVIADTGSKRISLRPVLVQDHAEAIPDHNAEFTKTLCRVTSFELAKKARIDLGSYGALTTQVDGLALVQDLKLQSDRSAPWLGSLAAVTAGAIVFVSVALNLPRENPKIEEQLKAQVVQIVKKIQLKQVARINPNLNTTSDVKAPVAKTTSKTASIKRLGALGALGSLKNGPQKGGLNLGAAQTTAGPGLGGSAGSGGVQTSLYGKGLVSAPLGAGGNMDGGGGYGTKGKGGGQAGYGKLSLTGSAGTLPIPLGREAIVGGGLDKDLISDVINRNLGQVRFCYEQGLQGDPALAGRVAVDFVIDGAGTVRTAQVGSTTLGSKLVEDCILMRLKTWKFPLPENGTDVKVSYPFVLRRSGQG